MEKTKERLKYIDMVKGLSIICIIFGHLSVPYIVQCVVSSFQVPIFYIVSGLLLAYKEKQMGQKTIIETIKSSVRTLIIPYFFFSFLFLLQALISSNLKFAIEVARATFNFTGVGALWFVPCLFFARILFIPIRKAINATSKLGKINRIVVLGAAAITAMLAMYLPRIVPVYYITVVIFRICFATLFYVIGYYSYSIIEKININAFVLMLILLFCFFIAVENGPFYAREVMSENIILAIMLACIESFTIISLMKKLPEIKPLSYCGKNSFILLGTHQLIIILLNDMVSGRIIEKTIIFVTVEFLLITVINRFLPFCVR